MDITLFINWCQRYFEKTVVFIQLTYGTVLQIKYTKQYIAVNVQNFIFVLKSTWLFKNVCISFTNSIIKNVKNSKIVNISNCLKIEIRNIFLK